MVQRGAKANPPHHREQWGNHKMSLRNGKVINHRRRIPVGVQVVVSLLEWHRICPDLVQESRQVLRIGS